MPSQIYVAFLGGINVGGHRVSMQALRTEFEQLGYRDVSTFIASGNVVFAAAQSATRLEPAIASHLARVLGYDVPTFVRGADDLVRVATSEPFGKVGASDTHLVAFLRTAPTAKAAKATEALSGARDRLVVRGKDLHWLVRGRLADSGLKRGELLRAVGQPYTTRNVKSLRKLASKLSGA